MVLKIAFNFITDYIFVPTTRSSGIVADLVGRLNLTYEIQTNVTFATTRDGPVQADTSLLKIVLEQREGAGRRIRLRRELDTLIAAGDPGADINVFFVPWAGTEQKRPLEILLADGNLVCPDGLSDDFVLKAVPHMIGRARGCSVDFNDRHRNYLMHTSRADELNPLPDRADFIPKIPRDCANLMNP